jgi:hypothetical protein
LSPDLDAVIAEAARKNGVGLRRDDPVLVLVTIMNRIGEDQRAELEKALERSRLRHEELADKWRRDALAAAETILNASLEAARRNLSSGLSEGAENLVSLLRREAEAMLAHQRAEAKATLREFRRLSLGLLAAVGLALAGTALLVLLAGG